MGKNTETKPKLQDAALLGQKAMRRRSMPPTSSAGLLGQAYSHRTNVVRLSRSTDGSKSYKVHATELTKIDTESSSSTQNVEQNDVKSKVAPKNQQAKRRALAADRAIKKKSTTRRHSMPELQDLCHIVLPDQKDDLKQPTPSCPSTEHYNPLAKVDTLPLLQSSKESAMDQIASGSADKSKETQRVTQATIVCNSNPSDPAVAQDIAKPTTASRKEQTSVPRSLVRQPTTLFGDASNNLPRSDQQVPSNSCKRTYDTMILTDPTDNKENIPPWARRRLEHNSSPRQLDPKPDPPHQHGMTGVEQQSRDAKHDTRKKPSKIETSPQIDIPSPCSTSPIPGTPSTPCLSAPASPTSPTSPTSPVFPNLLSKRSRSFTELAESDSTELASSNKHISPARQGNPKRPGLGDASNRYSFIY